MVSPEFLGRCMFSSGMVRLHPIIDRFYLFAFLKHEAFREQVNALTPRGATIRHAGSRWLDCRIPLPQQPDAEDVVQYVGVLARCIYEKEVRIRQRSQEIIDEISHELERASGGRRKAYREPTLNDILRRGRLDAATYDRAFQEGIRPLLEYPRGHASPTELGFTVTPGPSLELKLLKIRLDSSTRRPGYYELILPTNISEYGTLTRSRYLGTPKRLPLLAAGDVVIGEAGFHKGRSIVLVDNQEKTTTNAHGLYARHRDQDLELAVFFRCVFSWYRARGLLDLMAVGGSGGHLSPSYFDSYVRVPNFPSDSRQRVNRLYHNAAAVGLPSGNDLLTRHRALSDVSGVVQLNNQLLALRGELENVQDKILQGVRVYAHRKTTRADL